MYRPSSILNEVLAGEERPASTGNNRATCVSCNAMGKCYTYNIATLWKNVERSDAQVCNVRLWPTSRDRVSTNQRSSS